MTEKIERNLCQRSSGQDLVLKKKKKKKKKCNKKCKKKKKINKKCKKKINKSLPVPVASK